MRARSRPKHHRLAARVSPEQKALIQRAAQIEGRSLADYVVAVAEAAARETTRAREVLPLSLEGAQQFFTAVEHPPEPNERLRAAPDRYQALVRQ